MIDPKTMPIDQLDRELQSKQRSVYAYDTTSSREFYFQTAIQRGDLPRVEVYLRCGASPDPIKMKKDDNGRRTDWFPLEWAVASGKLEIVELLLQFGAHVNEVGLSTRRTTALRIAVENNYSAIVHKLLIVGACPESYQHHYGSAKAREYRDTRFCCDIPVLYEAVKRNNPEIAEMLLRKGAKANLPKSYKLSYSYLTEAVRAENPEMVALLLQFGADANFEVPKLGTTPLMMAAKAKKHAIDMAKLLVQHGANVNAQELVHKRQDALTIAVINSQPDLVQALLALGARANAVESAPLSAAVTVKSPTEASLQIVRMLIDRGAEPNRCDPNGVEPLFAAVEAGNTAIAEELLKRGAQANIVHGNMTPLKQAVLSGNEKLIHVLLRNGASPTAGVFAPSVIARGREICASAVQFASEHGSSSTILAILTDPQSSEPEPAPGYDDEEKAPLVTLLPPTVLAAMSRESAAGRLQPISASNESASTAIEGSRAEVKRPITRGMLCITWGLSHQAGRNLYCEWDLVEPDQPPLTMSTATATSYKPVQREPMQGVIIAKGRTTAVAANAKASSASPGSTSLLADWHNDGFKLNTCTTWGYTSLKAKAMDEHNQHSLLSCELRFRVKTEGGLLSTSKTVGEAWFQLSQLEIGAPLGTKAAFLVELSNKKMRTGTIAFELTY